jgi:hypothetical protein
MANCARTFIGDMMIMRVARDLPANTELTWCYHDPTNRAKLQKSLSSHWGFECSCPVCVDEVSTEMSLLKSRKDILTRISNTHTADAELFSKLESLFKSPAKDIPRYEVFRTFYSEAIYWFEKYNPPVAAEFAAKALEALGFVMDGFSEHRGFYENRSSKLVKQEWGVSVPEVARLW